MVKAAPLKTTDDRYIVVRDRLWRASNPNLPDEERERLVKALMDARRAVKVAKSANDGAAENRAHAAVDDAKVALGERGPVWWQDGCPISIVIWRGLRLTPTGIIR